MNFLLLSITIFLSTLGYSQTNEKETITKKENPIETQTISVITSSYSPNEIGGLKDHLIKIYSEEVTNPIYDEINQTFSFTYNDSMKKNDLEEIFKIYRVSFPQ